MPPLVESQYREKWLGRLRVQYASWTKQLNRAEETMKTLYPNGTPNRGETYAYRRLTAGIKKLRTRKENAKRELDRLTVTPYGIVIGHLNSGMTQKDRKNIEVRDKVYGGRGVLVETPTSVAVQITNMEVHSTFVEMRLRIWSKAIAIAKRIGGRSISKKYFATLEGSNAAIQRRG